MVFCGCGAVTDGDDGTSPDVDEKPTFVFESGVLVSRSEVCFLKEHCL